MFPFQKDDLCFKFSNDNNNNNNVEKNVINNNINNTNDVLQYNHQLPSSSSTSTTQNNTKKSSSKNSLKIKDDNITSNNVHQGKIYGANDDANNKKVIHREAERQRRQEMTNLYSSIRSILPLEYIKGKRSISDHISEATKYIKDLEMNVKELGETRDKLKETCNSSTKLLEHGKMSSTNNTHSSSRNGCNVSIHAFSKAIEIEICTGVDEEEDHSFPLSKVFKVLDEEGLDVVSCISSKLNKKWVHVIHCQVENVASIDSCQLQCRLSSIICLA